MSISNREDANKYYQTINGLVDEYVDKWKVKPSNLKKYLKPGSERFQRFLKKNNLDTVNGASRILTDVLDDRVSMEKDGVMAFESFKYFESNEFKIHSLKECLYKGIEKSTLNQEKILADHFDTNLGSIDILDSDKHLFKIEDWQGDDIKVVIYSDEEFDIIKMNMIEHLYDELSKKKVQLTDSIEIELDSLINYELFLEKTENKFNKEFTIKLITECLGDDWCFKKEVNSHLIWMYQNM